MLAKSFSLFIYYQKGPIVGPGTSLTEGAYESELGVIPASRAAPACLSPSCASDDAVASGDYSSNSNDSTVSNR